MRMIELDYPSNGLATENLIKEILDKLGYVSWSNIRVSRFRMPLTMFNEMAWNGCSNFCLMHIQTNTIIMFVVNKIKNSESGPIPALFAEAVSLH